MANYNGYNTYIIGTSSNASSSLEIVLYNNSDYVDLPKVSLYNMSQVLSIVTESKTYLRLSRETPEDPFIYNIDNGVLRNGFTVILYISTIDSSPIGYTEFLKDQGTLNDLNIYTSFNSSISDFLKIELNNSLSQLRNNSTVEKDFSDSETIYKYSSPEDINNNISTSSSYPRFTSHVYHVLENKQMSIKTDYGFINSELGAGKITLNTNINVDPYRHKYTDHQIGFYGRDVVLYSWSGNMYTIQSLVQRNRFGNPIVYTTEGGLDYNILEDLGNTRKILYFSGRFIVTITLNYPSVLELYDLERNIWVEPKYSNFYLDILDPRSIVTSIPGNVSISNISTYIPEIRNVFLNLDDFSAYTTLSIIKKIGDWYVFRNRISVRQDFYTYSCIDKTVHTVKLVENPMAINNSLLLVRTVDSTNNLDYYTIYYEPGIEYYTEKARASKSSGSLELDEELGILFCNNDDEESETYREYYKSGKIKVIHSKDGIFGNLFEGFRRGYYTSILDSENLNIIATFYGFIYYLDSLGNLNYI